MITSFLSEAPLALALSSTYCLTFVDQSLFELLLYGLGLVVLKVAASFLSFWFGLLPAVPRHSSVFPIFSCSLNLVIVFGLSCLRDGEFELLLPFLVCFFALFTLGRLVLFVPLPYEVFLGLVPHPFLRLPLLRILVLNHSVDLVCFDSWQIVKFCPLTGVFDGTNILRYVPEVFLC